MASIYSNLALIYGNSTNMEKEIEYNLLAINYVENNYNEVSRLYFNLAYSYLNAGLRDEALNYLNKAYSTSKKSNNTMVLGAAMVNLAEFYLKEEEFSKAKKYLKEADSLCQATNNIQSCYLVNVLWGYFNSEQKEFNKARKDFEMANQLAKEINNNYFLIESYGLLGRNELLQKNYYRANKNFKSFDSLYKKNPIPSLGVEFLKDWSRTEAALQNFNRSYELLNSYHALKDSFYMKEKREVLVNAEKKYEAEKKEREIAEQEVTIKEQELTLAKKQRQLALWGGLGGVLAILLTVSFWLNKERQKRKEQEITNLKNQQEIIRLESLVSGEEKERVRLAQDLHDGINGDLSVIKFKVDSLNRKKLNKSESETVENTLGMLDNAIDQVRRISHNLAPPSLQNFNLNEAITQHLGKIQLANKVTIDFQTFGEQPSFSVEQETAIYRIVQELLNNIVKHAEATETLVQLNHTADFTELVIEDNGKGFDTKISKSGIGLQNIASRVAFLKGDLKIESSGEGSTFTITLPKSSFA
nr:sensor histidine kinase [Croceivirga thetidis]